METIQILAERIDVGRSTAGWIVLVVCALISIISFIVTVCTDNDTVSSISIFCFLFPLFVIFISLFLPFCCEERTAYLIQITEETNFVEFDSLYKITERVSDTIFWCLPK